MRHTKIIATLGPATRTDEAIDALVDAGVDVFRLNFSHGTHEGHADVFQRVRRSAARAGRHVAILQDLSGPKIRTGRLAGGGPVELVAGRTLTIVFGDGAGTAEVVSTTYRPLATAVSPGDRLLLDDGRIELEVVEGGEAGIRTRIIDGGPLGEHKGINAPNVPLPAVGVTTKDAEDLAFGLSLGVDLVALSFVQSAGDLQRARQLADLAGRPDVPLIAKIERPEAVARLDEVMAAADAVMVARGDLGLELPMAEVPRVQREILRMGRQHGVPVIVATQVLESMRTQMRPTRAEVSDAAGAVDGGADAIMLSGETAIGAYPTRAVQVLDSIIRAAESIPAVDQPPPTSRDADHIPALCDAAVMLANQGRADALVAVTRRGRTARLLSARRPRALIYAATEREDVARRLALWHGVVPLTAPIEGDVDDVATSVVARIRDGGLPGGSTVVFVNASLDLTRDAANFVRIKKV